MIERLHIWANYSLFLSLLATFLTAIALIWIGDAAIRPFLTAITALLFSAILVWILP